MRTNRPGQQALSAMARRSNRKQEQLTLPELELFVAESVPDGETTENSVEALSPVAEPAKPEGEARKAPRKRVAKPTMVLVGQSAEASLAPAVAQASILVPVEMPHGSGFAEPLPAQAAATPDSHCEPAAAPAAVAPPITAAPRPPAGLRSAVPEKAADPLAAGQAASGSNRLRIGVQIGSIAASLAIVLALAVGGAQFIETQNRQRDLIAAQKYALLQARDAKTAEVNARAVELFLRYNDLLLQVNAPIARNARKETRYWKENLAVNLLESLFSLTRGNREWEATIGWALEKHGRFIREQRLSCAAYSPEFVLYLEKVLTARAVAFCRDMPTTD